MTEIINSISFNIYEPESSLKIYKNPKKKSIITKILKNPEIPPAKKQIKIKYNDINENTIHLNEYNIFRPPGEKILRHIKKEENNFEKNKNINIKNNIKNYKKNKHQNFIINRKQLERLNKNIPNNLYDYLHPYEYRYYSKKNNLATKFFNMQLSENKNSQKNNNFKILKLNDEDSNDSKQFIKYKSENLFLPLRTNLKTASNKKFFITSRKLKSSKNMRNDINTLKNIVQNNKNNNKLLRLKTKQINDDDNNYYNDEYSSSISFTENINNAKTETNLKKKLYINGNEISNNKLLYYNTLSSKNINSKKKIFNSKSKNTPRYNQKVFNRNNNIFTSYEEMKKLVFNSDNDKSDKKLKKTQNFLNFHQKLSPIYNSNKILNKSKKTKIIKDIKQLNSALNEIKFYMISDKIDREKYKEKLEELEKKMNYREDRVMITKDILFEKFNNSDNQNDYINHATNKNQYVNKLITSYININEKKTDGLLNKKFVGGLKKLNVFDMKDAMIRNVIGENNYFIKYRINRIEEGEISKNRKNLGDNMKHIKQMVKYIYNKKMHIGEGNK